MKNLFLVFFSFVVSISITNAQNKEKISAKEVPSEIHIFVKKHYPNAKIKKAYIDAEQSNNINYDIILSNKIELEFDTNFSLQEIESKNGVTLALIPKDIVDYVSEHYPNQIIIEWSNNKKDKHQEILLNNKTKLKFNSRGKFISAE